jgi:hypothetical protein
MGIKKLQKATEDQIGYNVSYGKARRAKEDIFESLYGTYEDAYNYDPRLLNQIVVTNRWTQVFLKYRPHPWEENQRILDRVLWAFPQTIQVFHHCRPVLSIDGTFLTGKYKGTLLVAIAADANNQFSSNCICIGGEREQRQLVVVSKLFEEWSREATSRCMHNL